MSEGSPRQVHIQVLKNRSKSASQTYRTPLVDNDESQFRDKFKTLHDKKRYPFLKNTSVTVEQQ